MRSYGSAPRTSTLGRGFCIRRAPDATATTTLSAATLAAVTTQSAIARGISEVNSAFGWTHEAAQRPVVCSGAGDYPAWWARSRAQPSIPALTPSVEARAKVARAVGTPVECCPSGGASRA